MLATKTLQAIEDRVAQDQGASYRQFLQKVLPHMGDAYRGEDEGFRTHLGASLIGKECGRALWYDFHWTTKPSFSGRILRLFNRGHLEEARFIALLLCIGVEVWQQDENGKQFRISDFGGHFGGSGDGVARGIPDLEAGTVCLLEFKTHNDASFKKLASSGVREAKFEHFVQMQIYMRKMQIPVALYMAVNKNDDTLYCEIVHLDPSIADQFITRAGTIIAYATPPNKLSESPAWFGCKWCDHRPVCHLKAAPEKNCRTCMYSRPKPDGKWYCENPVVRVEADMQGWEDPIELSKEHQLVGCSSYSQF